VGSSKIRLYRAKKAACAADVGFDVSFDFLDHQLRVQTSDDAIRTLTLAPRSVADFYREFMAALRALAWRSRSRPCPTGYRDIAIARGFSPCR
jgi:hypothetical protein